MNGGGGGGPARPQISGSSSVPLHRVSAMSAIKRHLGVISIQTLSVSLVGRVLPAWECETTLESEYAD